MNRQTMKSLAFEAVKKHYYIYIAACLMAAFLGTEFLESTTLISSHIPSYSGEEAISYYSTAFSSNDNMYDFIVRDYNKRQAEQKKDINNRDDSKISTQVFGRKSGVFAAAVNGITSGSFLSQFLMAVSSMTGSDNIAVFMLVHFLVLHKEYISRGHKTVVSGRAYI